MAVAKALVGTASRRYAQKVSRQEGIQIFDFDNAYPQRVLNTIAASGTTSNCTNRYRRFLWGRGFRDEAVGKIIVNRSKHTLSRLYRGLCHSFSIFNGFCLHFNYNINLRVAEMSVLPFEWARLAPPDDTGYVPQVAIHHDWDGAISGRKGIGKKDIDFYPIFNPDPDVVQKQIMDVGGIEKYKGQILYFTPDDNDYVPAVCDPVFKDVETDSKIAEFRWRMVKTGFIHQVIGIIKGKFESDQERQDLINDLYDHMGTENANSMMLFEAENDDQIPEFKPLESMIDDKLFEATNKTIKENIIQNYGQPLALNTMQQPGSLGLSREFKEAQQIYDDETEDERTLLSGAFSHIMKSWKDNVQSDFTIVPITGLESRKEKKTIAESMGGDASKQIQELLVSNMTPDQKVNFLYYIHGVEIDEARSLVNGTPINPTQ